MSMLLMLGAILPAAAHAGIMADFFAAITGAAKADTIDTADDASNLQSLTLPRPAMNINPAPATGGGDITIVGGTALLPQEGPSGTLADIDKPANSTVRMYTVQAGDTVDSVAKAQGVPVGILLSYNDLSRDTKLQAGQRLVILPTPSIRYTIKPGDTLESIAKKTGSDPQEIALANGVDNTTLKAGQTIDVPNGEVPAQSSDAAPTKSSTESASKSGKSGSSTKVLKSSSASCGHVVADAHNPSEPSHNVGPNGTCEQKDYYKAPLPSGSYVQTQGIHGYNAVDLGAAPGTPILAAAAGTVTVAREGGWNGGYGSYVVISHGNGSQTLYAHMSKVVAYDGEHVSQGQIIGYVGETGEATGPHLHFEIRNGIRNPF